MKKFYSLVVMAIVAMLTMTVSAKSIKVKANIANAVYLVDSQPINWGNIPTEATDVEWTNESSSMMVQPNTGFEIIDVKINDVSQNTGKVKSYTISTSVADGALVEVEASEVAMKQFTVVADANAVYINYNGSSQGNASNQVDGAWVYTPADYSTLYINAYPGYGIESITVGENTIKPSSPSYHSIYSGTYTTSQTFVINTYSFAEKRTSAAEIEINGDKSVVSVTRNGTSVDAAELDDFKFSSEIDLPIVFKHNNYQKDLYSVKVNDTRAQHVQDGGQWVWKITELNDGDKITVDTDYPEMDVPFKFVFTNEKTEGVVSSLYVNSKSVAKSEWSDENYTVALGSQYSVSFNYSDYTINSIKVNGVALSSFYSTSGIVDNETGVTIEIDATPGEMNTIKFNCRNWENVTVKSGYSNVIDLTDAETTVEVPASWTNFTISAKDGYRIVEVLYGETNIGTNFSLRSLEPVDGVYEIDIVADEMALIPFNLVLSNEGTEDVISYITVNNNTVDKSVWFAEGYQVPTEVPIYITFNSNDFDIKSIKVNGVEVQPSYGRYSYSGTTPAQGEFKLEIDAAKFQNFNVVFNCENWEKITLRSGSSTIELTGKSTEVELAPSNSSIYLYPASGYFVKSVTCGEYSSNSTTIDLKSLTANEDGKYIIDIEVEEFVRDMQMVVYLEERSWNNSQLILNPNSSLNQSISLQQGYNFIKFNESDIPFRLNIYGESYSFGTFVYLNGEPIEGQYGLFCQNEEVTDGAVIKIFQENEPEEHYVTLSVAEDANVNVHADYVTPVSGDFNIHHGSHIVITENTEDATPSAKPLAEGATAVPFKVTVGDQVIAANDKGQVIVPVTEELSIKVEKEDDPTAIDAIINEIGADAPVYNLQGIKVLENASNASRLPAGLYIINGKKVVLK